MIPTQMSNEQFALYIASLKYSSANDVTKIAEAYYKWLESNRKKPGYQELRHMREDIKLKPFDQAKYEARFQAIADEVDVKVLEQMIEIAKNKGKKVTKEEFEALPKPITETNNL
jgi:predicted HTH transcriptional regulator